MNDSVLTVRNLAEILDRLIPQSWALPEESVGIQAGDPEHPVRNVWPTVWVTRDRVRRAARRKVDFLLTYFPLPDLAEGRRWNDSPEIALLRSLFDTGTAVYCIGSAIDAHPQGTSQVLAELLGLNGVRPALPKPQSGQVKVVTFVPQDHTDSVRLAMAQAGAGRIGEYELCSFHQVGQGSFQGSERARPFVGEPGNLEFISEDRLEMLCPIGKLSAVIQALWESHPYEEPAYNVYKLQDVRDPRQALRLGETDKPMSSKMFYERLIGVFPQDSPPECITWGRQKKKIRRVACVAGHGSLIVPHLMKYKVDLFLCRGIGDRSVWELNERGIACLSLGRGILDTLFPVAIRQILRPWRKRFKVL